MSHNILKRLTLCLFALALPVLCGSPLAADDSDEAIVKQIDFYVSRSWNDNEIQPSSKADDGEWARRVSLDIVGHIPTYEQLRNFLEDDSPDKKQKFVEELLESPDYIRNWTTIWGNLLVGRGNNRQGNRASLDRWLRRQFYQNTPYNQFVYDLVSAEGSVDENGAVAFLASHLNDGAVPATSITSRVFLGLQVQCTQCHNHPFNEWKQDQFWSMNAFFQGTRRQGGGQRGAFALTDDPVQGVIFFEKRSGLMQATERKFVDGTLVRIDDVSKPRTQLAELITNPTKPYMAQTQVNRTWAHFFGYGFTKPSDDMGPHNPPSHPDLLNYLAEQFKLARFDQKRLIRWITATEAYSLSSKIIPENQSDNPSAGESPLFSHYYLKNFTAEQLYDSLLIATAADQANRNEEQAQQQREQWLRQFVQTFGTDENDDYTTFNGTIPQALVMMNGPLTGSALNGGEGSFLQKVLDSPNGDLRPSKSSRRPSRRPVVTPQNRAKNMPQKIETLFMVALARKPTAEELNAFNEVFKNHEMKDPIEGLQDVFWAILNSNEFIINH